MRRRLGAIVVALVLAAAVGAVMDIVIPEICTVAPWWPGCLDPAGGGGSGAGL